MKKGCLIAAGVGLVFASGVIFLVFALTHGVVDAGNAFLAQIGGGKIHEAYESASAMLKSQQTAGEFEENVKKLGLTDYASASWSNRQMENDRGQLAGTVTTRAGGKIPLHMELIKESGTWKVYALSAPQSGVIAEPPARSMPSDDKLSAMALDSLLAFNKAVKEKSFAAFQEQGSSSFREQLSPAKLLDTFKGFVDQEIDISSIAKVHPAFDPPASIDSDGVLILKGSYPTKPRPVIFQLKYVFESGGWKIQGINVKIPTLSESHPAQPAPSDEKLKKMVLESLMDFNKGVREKSFADFYKKCSAELHESVSIEKFNEAFQQFLDKGIDISSIAKVEPAFDEPPRVNSEGVLAASGSFASKPVVAFQLKYIYEDNMWKIIGINVNLP